MAEGDMNIKLVLEAQNNMSKELQRLQKDLSGANKNMGDFSKVTTEAYNKIQIAWAAAFGAISYGIKRSLDEASRFNNAMIGLKSIVNWTWQDFTKAQKLIDNFTQDGLVQAWDAATALKNLLSRGFSLGDAETILSRLKDSAAFGRQASLELWEAIKWATEGLKNENSILVDNAGVTKNVSVMRKEYAAQLWVWVWSLTTAQKRQAELNGIIRETKFQVGDAAKLSKEYSGQVAAMNAQMTKLRQTAWKALMPVFKELIKSLTPIIEKTAEWISKNPELTKNLILVGWAVTWVVAAIALLGWPVTLAVAWIWALSYAFIKLRAEVQKIDSWSKWFRALGNVVVDMVSSTLPALALLLDTLLRIRWLLWQGGTPGNWTTRVDAVRWWRNSAKKVGGGGSSASELEIPVVPSGWGGSGGKNAAETLKEAVEKSNKDFVELISKRAEQLWSSAKKVADWIKSGFEKQSDAVKQIVKDLVDLESKYKDFGESAKRSLYEVRAAMIDLNSSFTDKLGSRFVDLKNQLETSTDLGTEKVQEIRKEMQLIRDTIGNDAISKAFDIGKLSESEKMIQEWQSKQGALTEKQALLEIQKNAKLWEDLAIRFEEQAGILKAYYTTKDGIEKEVKDKENLALAQEIIDKQTAYTKDYENIKSVLAQTYQAQVEYLASVQSEYDRFSQYMDNQTRRSTEAMIGQYQKLLSVISLVNAKTWGKYTWGISQEYVPTTTVTGSSKSSEGIIINVGWISIANGQDPKVIQMVVQEAVVNAARRLQTWQL